jgi:hypothetical protein
MLLKRTHTPQVCRHHRSDCHQRNGNDRKRDQNLDDGEAGVATVN